MILVSQQAAMAIILQKERKKTAPTAAARMELTPYEDIVMVPSNLRSIQESVDAGLTRSKAIEAQIAVLRISGYDRVAQAVEEAALAV